MREALNSFLEEYGNDWDIDWNDPDVLLAVDNFLSSIDEERIVELIRGLREVVDRRQDHMALAEAIVRVLLFLGEIGVRIVMV